MVLLITGPRWPNIQWSKEDYNETTQPDYFIIDGTPIFTQVKAEVSSFKSESDLEIGEEIKLSTALKHVDFEREHTTNTSKVVWDASIVLAKYLEKVALDSKLNLKAKRVLELGAGQGVVGLACALLRASVTLTDTPEAVPALKNIVALNGLISKSTDLSLRRGHIEEVVALDWLVW